MTKYQLPCSCGAILPVGIAQAGSNIPCPQCGVQVDVPTTRALRNLPPVVEAKSVPTRSSKSFAFLRLFCALLLLAGLGGIGMGTYMYLERVQSGIKFSYTEEDYFADIYKITSTDPPAVVWDHWNYIAENGLPRPQVHPNFAYKRYLDAREPWMYGYTIVGVVSLALFAGLCVIMSRSGPKS